jgi:hypothetical protein
MICAGSILSFWRGKLRSRDGQHGGRAWQLAMLVYQLGWWLLWARPAVDSSRHGLHRVGPRLLLSEDRAARLIIRVGYCECRMGHFRLAAISAAEARRVRSTVCELVGRACQRLPAALTRIGPDQRPARRRPRHRTFPERARLRLVVRRAAIPMARVLSRWFRPGILPVGLGGCPCPGSQCESGTDSIVSPPWTPLATWSEI